MSTTVKKATVSRPIIAKPMLLVFKEKHGRRHFHVIDDKALLRAALHVLTERHKEGYWYPKPETSEKPHPPDVAEADIEKLPTSLRETAKEALRNFQDWLAAYEKEVSKYADIVKAVATKDGRAAWTILRDRRNYEYEGFELESYEDVK